MIYYLLFHLLCAFVAYGYGLADSLGYMEARCGPNSKSTIWIFRLFHGFFSLLGGPVMLITTGLVITSDDHHYGFRLS